MVKIALCQTLGHRNRPGHALWPVAAQRLLHEVVVMFLRYRLSFVSVFHSYDYFSSGVSCSIIPQSFGSFT
jgi:hypothetical protein